MVLFACPKSTKRTKRTKRRRNSSFELLAYAKIHARTKGTAGVHEVCATV